MLWKPYDVRFDEFKTKMKVHRNILEFALSLHHIKISKQAIDRDEMHFKEVGLKRVMDDDRAKRMQIVTEETKAVLDLQQKGIFDLSHRANPAHLLFLSRPGFSSPPTMDRCPQF